MIGGGKPAPGQILAQLDREKVRIVVHGGNHHKGLLSGARDEGPRQDLCLSRILGHARKHPGHIGQVHRLVGRDRINQGEPGLGHHLLGQVGRGAVDAADDGPDPVDVGHPCDLGDT